MSYSSTPKRLLRAYDMGLGYVYYLDHCPVQSRLKGRAVVKTTDDQMSLEDSRVIMLLKWMIDESKIIAPSVKEGQIAYPDVTGLVPVGDPVGLLDRLSVRGYLKREYHSSEILCPQCASSLLRDQYTCVSCQGGNLETGEMVEHYSCGNVDFEDKFTKEGRLVCPKCGKELKVIGTDYRRVGKAFKCNDCGRDSSIPRVTHVCQNCGTVSTYERVRLRTLYRYRINEEKKKEVESLIGIYSPLAEFLQKRGFKVESPAFLTGESGIVHPFDIVAQVDGKPTVFDIRTGTESVDETAVISFFAKTVDVVHQEAILVAVPKASAQAKRLGKLYNIGLVEGSNINEILASMAVLSLEAPATPLAQIAPTVSSTVASSEIKDLQTRMTLLEEEATRPKEAAPPIDSLRTLQSKMESLEKEQLEQLEDRPQTEKLKTLRAKVASLEEERTEPQQEKLQNEKLKALQARMSVMAERDKRSPEAGEEIEDRLEKTEPIRTTSPPAEMRRPPILEDKRLLELERLRFEGKLGEEEYQANRERILKMIGARTLKAASSEQ